MYLLRKSDDDEDDEIESDFKFKKTNYLNFTIIIYHIYFLRFICNFKKN